MALDPNIVAIFGEPPPDMDVDSAVTELYNIVICVVFGLAVAIVGLRFWVRKMKTGSLWIDDWAMLVGVVSLFLSFLLEISGTFYFVLGGLPMHQQQRSAQP